MPQRDISEKNKHTPNNLKCKDNLLAYFLFFLCFLDGRNSEGIQYFSYNNTHSETPEVFKRNTLPSAQLYISPRIMGFETPSLCVSIQGEMYNFGPYFMEGLSYMFFFLIEV